MTKRGLMFGLVAAVATYSAQAGMGEWRNYTSMKDVRSVARKGSAYWGATSGGLFRWDEPSNTFLTLTNAEGLQSIDLTAVAIDSQGTVWSGSSTGYLHALSPATQIVRVVPDIANLSQSNKQIYNITVVSDTLLIATDIGLSTFHVGRFEFGDTYTHFGSIPTSNTVKVYAAAVYAGKLWAAITDGQTNNDVAFADLSNPNLLPPGAWTLQNVGSPTVITSSLGVFGGKLYAGTTAGLYVSDGTTWTAVPALAGLPVQGISPGPSALLVCTNTRQVFSVDAAGTVSSVGQTLPFDPTGITSRPNGDPVVASTGGGLLVSPQSWTSVNPNGPNGNQFINVVADEKGILWGASGSSPPAAGFYRYDGKTWLSYTAENSAVPIDEVYKVSVGCNGSLWASSWGAGVVEMPSGTTTVDSNHVYGTNVGMRGIGGPPDPNYRYIVVSNVVCDSRGNTWLTTGGQNDRRILDVRRAEGTWSISGIHINSPSGPALTTIIEGTVDRALAVDAYDNIWAAVRDGTYQGVASLANAGSIDSVANVFLTVANGLPSNDIRTIVVDQDNTIWVGTDKGIGIILDPLNPTRTGAVAAYWPLQGLVINTIAVDPLNQKWVGTSEGAILLSADGTQELASYTVESTSGKLMDNNVRSIAVDPTSGTVYFGTASGLASLTTPAAAPRASFNELNIYPNPYRVPNSTPLTVNGLVQNSNIKILTIDGRLVRDLTTPGGRIGFWDGKDKDGNTVSSGIYIIVAYSEDGSEVANGKVAVLRR